MTLLSVYPKMEVGVSNGNLIGLTDKGMTWVTKYNKPIAFLKI